MCIPRVLKLTDIMAQVKHIIKNGIVNLKQAVSGRKTGINVSLYEYVDEEDKPQDEYIFNNKGASSLNYGANDQKTETVAIESKYGHEGSWSNTPFTCTSKPNWANVTESDSSISVTVSGNSDYQQRSGSIVLTQTYSSKTIEISITQAASEYVEPSDTYVFEASPTTVNADYDDTSAESVSITSTKNGGFLDFEISSQPDDWATCELVKNNTTGGSMNITLTENESYIQRSTNVTLRQNETGDTKTVRIVQRADVYVPPASKYDFYATPSSLSKDADDTSSSVINITSTKDGGHLDWIVESQPESWVTYHENVSGDKLTISFSENDSTSQRSTSISLKQNETNRSITIDLTQLGKEQEVETTYHFTIAPTSLDYSYAGGERNVVITSYSSTGDVETPHGWKYSSGAESWVESYDRDGSGKTDSFNIKVLANDTHTERRCTLLFRQNSPSTNTCEVTLVQAAAPEDVYVFNATSSPIEFTYNASDSKSSTITSTKNGQPCDWEISTTDVFDWLNYSKSENKVDFSVTKENNTEVVRTQIISLRQLDGSDKVESIVVKQDFNHSTKPTYTFTATPQNVNIGANGNKVDVTVVSKKHILNQDMDQPVTWTAKSDADWCKTNINGQTLEVSANPNTTKESKSTTITLTQSETETKLIVNVTQDGEGDKIFSISADKTEFGSKGGECVITITDEYGQDDPWVFSTEDSDAEHGLQQGGNGSGTDRFTLSEITGEEQALRDKEIVITATRTNGNRESSSVTIKQWAYMDRSGFNEEGGQYGYTCDLTYSGKAAPGSSLTTTYYSRTGNKIDGYKKQVMNGHSGGATITGIDDMTDRGDISIDVSFGNLSDDGVGTLTITPNFASLQDWDDMVQTGHYTLSEKNDKQKTLTVSGDILPMS